MLLKYLRPFMLILPLMASGSLMAGEAPRFMSVIDDLPLMEGLQEIGDGVQFATSGGRIAEVTAKGSMTKTDVLDFYARTLPQLGWTYIKPDQFVREGETLELVFEKTEGPLNVRFALAPTGAKK